MSVFSQDTGDRYGVLWRECRPLSTEEEIALARRYRETGDVRCRNRLVEANLRLVGKVALEYAVDGVEIHDLIQEGSDGLLTAAEHYDPDRGWRFTSYGIWWIRQRMRRFVLNAQRMIRVPANYDKMEHRARMRRAEDPALGDIELEDELAEEFDLGPATVRRALAAPRVTASLDRPLRIKNRESGRTLHGVIGASEDENRKVDQSELKRTLEEVLCELPEREADIVRLYFGLSDEKPPEGERWTLQQIGERYGVTRERVRQMREEALRKLRYWTGSRKLGSFWQDLPGTEEAR